MKAFLNPGHSPNGRPDPGACNEELDLRECDIAKSIADRVQNYLELAGVEVVENLQSNNLDGDDPDQPCICDRANASGADIVISIHCNSFGGPARGTETLIYGAGGEGEKLARCIQSQIVDALGTADRGIKERPGLAVLRETTMPAVLVETAFISDPNDAELLKTKQDEFARAIARGVTDYESL